MISSFKDLFNSMKDTTPTMLLVAGAENTDVLKAVQKAVKNSLLFPILLGNRNKIENLIKQYNIAFKKHEIVDTSAIGEMVKLASEYLYNSGKKIILMKGIVTTADLMREVIKKDNKLRDSGLISHIAIFESPEYHKLFCITDVAINIAPDLKDKKLIIDNAVSVMRKIGIKIPKVACLSAIEYVNPAIQSSVDAATLRAMNQEKKIKECIVEGPFGLDNAISQASARLKGIVNEVAGDADILLVPNLSCGNILYKSLIYFGKAQCAAIITGAKIPIVLTSRADTIDNKYNSILLAKLISSHS